MKKFSILALALLLASCGANNNRAGSGFIVTSTTDALYSDNNVRSSRTGEACSRRILGMVTFGDASISAAKRHAGISRVATADVSHFSLLGLWGTACTVVYGE